MLSSEAWNAIVAWAKQQGPYLKRMGLRIWEDHYLHKNESWISIVIWNTKIQERSAPLSAQSWQGVIQTPGTLWSTSRFCYHYFHIINLSNAVIHGSPAKGDVAVYSPGYPTLRGYRLGDPYLFASIKRHVVQYHKSIIGNLNKYKGQYIKNWLNRHEQKDYAFFFEDERKEHEL